MTEEALRLIPIRMDVYTHIFLIGTIQSFFLSLLVGWKSKLHNQILLLLSFFLFIIGALILDLYFARSGIMRQVLWYNDITEWMVLCLGPTLYLISDGLLHKSKLRGQKVIAHFTIPFLYFCYQFFYIVQPIEAKYNAYVGAFHKELDMFTYSTTIDSDPLFLKSNFERILLFSLIAYAIAGFVMMIRSGRFPNWKDIVGSYSKYTFILWSFGCLFVNGVVLFFLFLFTEENDSHLYIGLMITTEVSLLYILFIGTSSVFSSSWIADKYDTSGVKDLSVKDIYKRIHILMSVEQPYLKPKYGLKDLAKRLSVPSNHVSQAINSTEGKNFNEYINGLRVAQSIIKLEEGRLEELTIEGIGREVGFSSKSTFFASFKKVTGMTPMAYHRRIADVD